MASTKCHAAQIVMLQLLALHLARRRGTLGPRARPRARRRLLALPGLVGARRSRKMDEYLDGGRAASPRCRTSTSSAAGVGYAVALEGALKLKELAYVRAEAYPAGEMKHGPIALIDARRRRRRHRHPGPPVGEGDGEHRRGQGAWGDGRGRLRRGRRGDEGRRGRMSWRSPSMPELLSPAVAIVPLQALAYGVARARGNDVDRPRNLAKVVTVE